MRRSCYQFNFHFSVYSIRCRVVQVVRKVASVFEKLYGKRAEISAVGSSLKRRLLKAGEGLKDIGSGRL